VLREELGRPDGLADPGVYVLDPCCGTGAYVVEVLRTIAAARRDGVLGQRVADSACAFDMEVRVGAGAYVCGEETSLLDSLDEKRGLVRWLRPEFQRARAGVAPEPRAEPAEEQLEAPLVIAAATARKPAFPTSDLERTAAVFAALTKAARPLDAKSIAAHFRQGRKIEPSVTRILAAFARMGQFYTGDGERFTPRRGG